MSKIKNIPVLLLALCVIGVGTLPILTMAQTSTTTATTSTTSTTATTTLSDTSTTTMNSGTNSGQIITTGTSTFIPVSTTNTNTITIVTNLYIGSTGSEVTALQNFLAQDTTVYPEGLVTGYFGPLTEKAVRKFQKKYGIAVVGRVGPLTRNKINSLMGGGMTPTTYGDSPRIFNVSTSTQSNQDGTRAFTLSWQTDRATRAKVFYSTSPLTFSENQSPNSEPFVSGTVISDTTFGTSKTLSISNLSGATTYNYMIEAIDGNGNVSVTWPTTVSTQ